MTSTFIREHKADKTMAINPTGDTEIIFEDIMTKKPSKSSDFIKIHKHMSCFKTLVPLCDRHSGVFSVLVWILG